MRDKHFSEFLTSIQYVLNSTNKYLYYNNEKYKMKYSFGLEKNANKLPLNTLQYYSFGYLFHNIIVLGNCVIEMSVFRGNAIAFISDLFSTWRCTHNSK